MIEVIDINMERNIFISIQIFYNIIHINVLTAFKHWIWMKWHVLGLQRNLGNARVVGFHDNGVSSFSTDSHFQGSWDLIWLLIDYTCGYLYCIGMFFRAARTLLLVLNGKISSHLVAYVSFDPLVHFFNAFLSKVVGFPVLLTWMYNL